MTGPGLNDIRVLRNFLGDEHHEEDYELPKFKHKRLNMGRLDIKHGKVVYDNTSRNAEQEVIEYEQKPGWQMRAAPKTEFISVPKTSWKEYAGKPFLSGSEGIYAAGPNEQVGGMGLGRAITGEGWDGERYIAPETTKASPKKESPGTARVVGTTKVVEAQFKDTPETKKAMSKEDREKEAEDMRQLEIKKWNTLAYNERNRLVEQQTREQSRKDLENARLGVQQLRFERSGFGKFLQTIHNPQLAAWGGRVQENIGQNMGGSLLGSFESKGVTQKVRETITAKKAYIEWLRRKHNNPRLSGPTNATEEKKFMELDRAISRAQSAAAGSGFMGGGMGRAIVSGSSQIPNIRPFTQIGYGGGENYGTFGPEALSRLGVTQGLQSMSPINKWDALLGRGSGQDVGKITQILGKAPNPLGRVETPADRVRRFL